MDSPQDETSVDAGRELWLQARKQLSEYELRNSELQLDLQQALRGCQSLRDTHSRVNKEANALQASKAQFDGLRLRELSAMQALQAARSAEMLDTQRLVQQLSMQRQKLLDAQTVADAERKAWAAHLLEQEEHNRQLEDLLASPSTPAMEG